MEHMTRQDIIDKLASYLQHRISLAELVNWAEQAMMEGNFESGDYDVLRDAVARLGLADVRAFGLTWEECEDLVRQLGYRAEVTFHPTNGQNAGRE